jgi:hypothetical protein
MSARYVLTTPARNDIRLPSGVRVIPRRSIVSAGPSVVGSADIGR